MASPTVAKQNILEIEKSLGIWWPRGLSRQKDGRKIPAVAKLLKEFERITQRYGCMSQREIRRSEALRQEASTTFLSLGKEIWPDVGQDRSAWLVADAKEEDLGGLYPKNLYFSDAEDRQKLHDLFQELVVAKCIRYYENHGRHWHYELDQADDPSHLLRANAKSNEQQRAAGYTKWLGAGAPGPRLHTSPVAAANALMDAQAQESSPDFHFHPLKSATTMSGSDDTPATEVSPAGAKRSLSPAPLQLPKRTRLPDDTSMAASRGNLADIASRASESTAQGPAGAGNDFRSDGLPYEILGELIDSPTVVKILNGGHAREINRQHWNVLKEVLISHPAAREDSNLLHAELKKIEKVTDTGDRTSTGALATARAVTAPISHIGRPIMRATPPEKAMLPLSRPSMAALPATMNGAMYDRTPPRLHTIHSHRPWIAGPSPRRALPSAAPTAPILPRMNIWLRLKDARVRMAIMLDKEADVVEVFSIVQQRLAHRLNGRPVVSLTFTHVGKSIEDDPIEVEARDQTTWEALLAMVLLYRGQEPVELKAVIDF